MGEYGGSVKVTQGPKGLHLVGSPHGDADLRFVRGTTFTDGRALYTFDLEKGSPTALWADLTWALVRWDRKQPAPPAARMPE